MRRVYALYAVGVLVASLAGFFCPFWFLGFVPLSAGLLWAAYDLVEVANGEPSSTPQR